MFCHNCGAKLKDYAKFCTKCGTKVETDDFDDENDMLEEDDDKVPNESHDPDKFKVRIGEYQITYPESVKSYVSIMSMLENATQQAKKEFDIYYRNAKAVTSSLFEDGLKCLDIVLESILTVMGRYGVYELKKEHLLNARDYGQSALEIWKNCSGYFLDIIGSIASNAQSERDARERRKESRFRVVGGGFGLTGAAKGMLEAAAINAVTGAAHSVFNMFGNASTDSAERKSKQELYRDPRTLNTLQYGLALAGELLKKEALYLVGIRPFPINSAERANVILDNIKNGRVDGEHLQEALIQVFSLNPFAQDAYVQYLSHYGDPDGSLQQFADTFNLGNAIRSGKNAAFRKAIAVEFHLDMEANDYDMFADKSILEAIDGKRDAISLYIEKDTEIIKQHIEKITKWQNVFTSEIGQRILEDLSFTILTIEQKERTKELEKWSQENLGSDIDPHKVSCIGSIIGTYDEALHKNICVIEWTKEINEIGRGAFYKASFGNEGAAPFSIIMPPTLRKIGSEAFAYSDNLGEVVLNDGLEYIGDRAFMGCEGLKVLRIPSSVTYLGKDVGRMGPTLDLDADSPAAACIRERNKDEQYPWLDTKVMGQIPEGGWNWDSDMIKIPAHYTAIEQYLFQESRASKLVLHSGIREISEGCFRNSKIEKIEFAEGLQRIGKHAFESCYELKKAVIPSTVKEIAEGAFQYCGNIIIELSEGLEKLGAHALYTLHLNDRYDSEHLETVYLPESLTEIGENVVCEFTTIECVKGSLAWKYAKDNGCKYKEVPPRATRKKTGDTSPKKSVSQRPTSSVVSQSKVVSWWSENSKTGTTNVVPETGASWCTQYRNVLDGEPNAHIVRVAELLYESNPESDVFYFVQSKRLQAGTFNPNDQWALSALSNIRYAITTYAASALNEEIPLFVYAPSQNSDAGSIFVSNQAVYLSRDGYVNQRINNLNIVDVSIANEKRKYGLELGAQISYVDENQYQHNLFTIIDGPTTQVAASIVIIAEKVRSMSEEQRSPSGWITVGAFRDSYVG